MSDFFKFMTRFFQGWKRKFGFLTLVMALGVMVGWMRSIFIADVIEYTTGKFSKEEFHSADGFLEWWSDESYDESAVPFDPVPSFHWNGGTTTARFFNNHYRLNEVKMEWHFRWPCLGVGNAPTEITGNASRKLCFVSYWLIVAPLTALSAYLLIKKPCQSNQAKTAQPIHDEGT